MPAWLVWALLHPAAVWCIVGASLCGAAWPVTRWLTGWVARKEARAVLRRMGPPGGELAPGRTVVLEGVLLAPAEPCPRFEDGAPVAAATADGGLRQIAVQAQPLLLQLGGASLALTGPVRVLAGTREVYTHTPITASRPALRARLLRAEPSAEQGLSFPLVLRSLRAGDRVRASGVLQEVQGSAGYRERAAALTLVPDPDGSADAVPLAALDSPAALHPRWIVATANLLVALCLQAGVALGLYASWLGTRAAEAPAPARLVVAALLPPVRQEAIAALYRHLEHTEAPDHVGQVHELAALFRRLGSQRLVATDLLEHGQWEAGLADGHEALRERADPKLANALAAAHLALGQLDRASQAVRGHEVLLSGFAFEQREALLRSFASFHLLADDREAALSVARAAQALPWDLQPDAPERRFWGCAEAALSGRVVALQALSRSTGEAADTPCALLLASLQEGAARRVTLRWLVSHADPALEVPRSVGDLVFYLDPQVVDRRHDPPGMRPSFGDPRVDFATPADPRALELSPLWALMVPMHEALRGKEEPGLWDLVLRARWGASRAILASRLGDHAEALRLIDAAVSDTRSLASVPGMAKRLGSTPQALARPALILQVQLALRGSAPALARAALGALGDDPAAPLLEAQLRYRQEGQVREVLLGAIDPQDPDPLAVLAALAQGDGAALARRWSGRLRLDVPALLLPGPALRTGQAQLQRLLRHRHVALDGGASLERWLPALADQQELADRVGDTAGRDEARARMRVLLAALLRPDTAVLRALLR